ncbi:protein required for normal CLN1 and CLN2 G1 cyclin expression [Mycoemilia scoparia]|uniref:Protein required for normal CLN1 and CLN2 G1 cyclin expression n=1 Tax=Mycoemilia scoparia TaxID=417184 RepID=A0A9W8A3L2_9FUNG|nr:protein required for normal CLN1 and CLN2 G1 cyclin expression [Mycoemilia scoparia]
MEAPLPRIIEVPLYGSDNVLEIDCNQIPDKAHEMCDILLQEKSPPKFYLLFALEYYRKNKIDESITALKLGLSSVQSANQQAKLPLITCLASLYIQKAKLSQNPSISAFKGANDHDTAQQPASERDKFLQLATALLNEADRINTKHPNTLLCKGLLCLSMRQFDNALQLFSQVVNNNPSSLTALLGKARAHYAKKQYIPALQIYQHVLTLSPYGKPDARVGIGLCFQKIGMKGDACKAFQRAVDIDGSNVPARILLATSLLNRARDQLIDGSVQGNGGHELVQKAMEHIQTGYMNQPNHITLLLLLSDRFFYRGEINEAKSLAVKAMAVADSQAIQIEAQYQVARCLHKQGLYDQAYEAYNTILKVNSNHIRARFGFGQMEIHKGLWSSAVITFEAIIERFPKCVEAMRMLAFIHTQLPNHDSQALEYYNKELKLVLESSEGHPKNDAVGQTNDIEKIAQCYISDPDILLETANLYEKVDSAKALQYYRAANHAIKSLDSKNNVGDVPELLNNIGSLAYSQDMFDVAIDSLTKAVDVCLTALKSNGEITHQNGNSFNIDDLHSAPPPVNFQTANRRQKRHESAFTTSMYNFARIYECLGKWLKAEDIYKQLIKRHPHYIDAQLRVAFLEQTVHNRIQDAVDIYNDAMALDQTRITTRLLQGSLQLEAKQVQAGRRTYEHVLKQLQKHNLHSLCSLGNFYLSAGRSEQSQPSLPNIPPGASRSAAERKHQQQLQKKQQLAFSRYNKALQFFTKCIELDEKCVVAAQGIAIAMAENGKYIEARDLLVQVREAIMKDTAPISTSGTTQQQSTSTQASSQYEDRLFIKKDRVMWTTLNLGHVYTELGQFQSAVLMYEACIKRLEDPTIFPDYEDNRQSKPKHLGEATDDDKALLEKVCKAEKEERLKVRKDVDICLARALYVKAKTEKDLGVMKQALEKLKVARKRYYTELPSSKNNKDSEQKKNKSSSDPMLEIFEGDDPLVMFNLALVGQQFANLVSELPQEKRSLQDLMDAMAELDESTKLFNKLAKAKNVAKDLIQEQKTVSGTNGTNDEEAAKATRAPKTPQIRFPYDPAMAVNRAGFGKSLSTMLKRKHDGQVEFEAQKAAQREEFIKRREAQREEAERKRKEEEKAREAEEERLRKLTEERNAKLREEMAAAAALEASQVKSERSSKSKARVKDEFDDDEEDDEPYNYDNDDGEAEQASKSRRKKRKVAASASADDLQEGAAASTTDYEQYARPVGGISPSKRQPGRPSASNGMGDYDSHGRKYKSKVIVESSDEESDTNDQPPPVNQE